MLTDGCLMTSQSLQLGKPLGLSDKVHASVISPRKQIAESTMHTYCDRLSTDFAFKPTGQEGLEVIITRILYMSQTGRRTVPAPRTLVKWLGADAKVNMSKVKKMRQGMDNMIDAMQEEEARMDGETEQKYSVSLIYLFQRMSDDQLSHRHSSWRPSTSFYVFSLLLKCSTLVAETNPCA